jgi:hypothetical protein
LGSSASSDRASDASNPRAQPPPPLGGALRHLRAAAAPPRIGALLRLLARLEEVRAYRAQLRRLVRRARRLVPEVSDEVARVARTDPDGALATFLSAFQRAYVELDESICEEGFAYWTEVAADSIPLLLRGSDRCNGIEPLGYRPGYALMWALIEDVFFADDRAAVLAEVAEAFGAALADRLEAAAPPPHAELCLRLDRSAYAGLSAFSRHQLGDVSNPVLFLHQHHADELRLRWTRRDVDRAVRLVRQAEAFEARTLALAAWLEQAPAEHGPLLARAALGQPDARRWSPADIQPCAICGFPPAVRTHDDALVLLGLPDASHHAPDSSSDREEHHPHGFSII